MNFKVEGVFNCFWLLTRILGINLPSFECIGLHVLTLTGQHFWHILAHLGISEQCSSRGKGPFIWEIRSLLRVNLAAFIWCKIIAFNYYTESNRSLWRLLLHIESESIPTMKNWSVDIMYLFLKQTSKPYSLLGYKVEIYEVEESFTSLKLRF